MLTLTLRDSTPAAADSVGTTLPIEVDALLPETLRELSLAEIERQLIWHGKQQVPVAELFDVRGNAADEQLEFVGNLTHVHHLGSGQSSGVISVVGSAGRHVGAGMRGGELIVERDVSDWLGTEMTGGYIRVHGSAGHNVGGAYRGSARGMRGGTILVDGNVGHECGQRMRRGFVAVGGSCGDLPAAYMLAGTVVICGNCGLRPGAAMRRGTLALLGNERPTLLPTFQAGSVTTPVFMRLYFRELAQRRFAPQRELDALTTFDSFHGDLLALGRGEILCPHC